MAQVQNQNLLSSTWLVDIYLLFILGILRGVRKFHRIVRFNADQHEGGEEANKNAIVDNIEIEDKLSKLKAEDKRCESFQTGLQAGVISPRSTCV